MNINKIGAVFERIYGGVGFTGKVRVYVAGSALNIDDIHSGAHSYAFYKIDRRNNCGVKPEFFTERGKSRLFSGAPEPDGIGRLESACAARFVDRVMFKQRRPFLHQLAVTARKSCIRKVFPDFFADDIVRTREIIAVIRAVPYKAVTIADAGIKVTRLIRKLFVERLYQRIRFLGRYLIGAVIEHHAFFVGLTLNGVGKRYGVAPYGNVSRLHVDPHAHGFER